MVELKYLVERSREGDLEAFTEVVRRFQDMAHGYAYSILGDFHLAEDAAQEAFVDAYYKLDALREPAAFPGWFRRIVFKHCDRAIQKKSVPTVPLEEGMRVAEPNPERSELQERVLEAIRDLPERQREATTLYYINGYSQDEISDFLEVPVTTVKKRLHDSRKKLKERMLGMVEETLKNNAPDERFSQKVIDELLNRPNYLQIEGHPVRKAFEAIRAGLPQFDYLEGQETIDEVYVPQVVRDRVYRLNDGRVLRSDTTMTALELAAGRTPPVRFLTAGRVFRPDAEDAAHAKMFHEVDGLCIDVKVTVEDMKSIVRTALEAVLDVSGLEWEPHDFPGFEDSFCPCLQNGGERIEVAGCGMLTSETLTRIGLDPHKWSGFAFGISLERLAMLKHGIADIHDLRRPPCAQGF